jgi:hypothetical protein
MVIILLYANVKVFVEKNKKQSGGGMVDAIDKTKHRGIELKRL